MKAKIIVFFILVCSFVLFQQCATIHASKNATITAPLIEKKPKLDSLRLYKDSLNIYKGLLLKVKEIKPELKIEHDTLYLDKIKIDSARFNLLNDSLQIEKEKNKLLKDSLGFEKAKLLSAYLKSDTLMLRTKQLFEAKILSIQKNNNPKILYKLVPYTVIKKDLKAVIFTALSVFLFSFMGFFLLWNKVLRKKDINANERKDFPENTILKEYKSIK